MSDKIPEIAIRAELTRKMGDDLLKLEASSYAPAGNEAHEYNRLFGVLRSAMNDYINNVLPSMPRVPAAEVLPSGEWFPVTRFSVSMDKGKRYVKVHTGKYEKFGVVIYPEAAVKSNFDLLAIPSEGYTPKKPVEVLISTNREGKPRVERLRWNEAS